MSLGILNSEALFKQDKSASKHDVNVNYHKYNFRTNIDADLTKTTLLSFEFGSSNQDTKRTRNRLKQ